MPKHFSGLRYAVLTLVVCLFQGMALAQNYTQTLKGTVLDKVLKTPLPGATVILSSLEPKRGVTTDEAGNFRLEKVPLGKQTIDIQYIGYTPLQIPNISINSGKETSLVIELEENIIGVKEITITAKIDKEKPLNELASVSARTFSVEETQRFAAAVNDPARMAASFAGVNAPGDGNNIIVIRGNAPNGLLWRMEGVDIPNPNHFSSVGTSGGGISILSAQLLSNSDFITGAFPAEYGNAVSGVFDLRLRKGNSEKREYTLQAGLLGLDVAAEGPLRMGKQTGSYLFNYRYSTLSLIGKLGVNLGDAVTNFQDLSFNIWMPAGKAGSFTLFGMGGLSDQSYPGKTDSLEWLEDESTRFSGNFKANTGVLGLTHRVALGEKSSLRNVVAWSAMENTQFTDFLLTPTSKRLEFDNRHLQQRLTFSSVLNHKFNARHLLRTGAYMNLQFFDFQQRGWDRPTETLVEQVRNDGQAVSINAFAQWQYRIHEKLTLSSGAHFLYFFLNNTHSLEPRAALKYSLSPRSTLSLGYGRHGQLQSLGTYFVQLPDEAGQMQQPNRKLKPSMADHFVLSFDQMLPGKWHIKPELYYQALSEVPVSSVARNSYSLLNLTEGFPFEALKNGGKGRNFGAELTLEKFLDKGFYCLLSSAVFKSEYQGSDQIWLSTRFDTRYVSSLVGGKEWSWNKGRKNRSVGFNVKLTHAGGLRQTPINLPASIAAGEAVYFEDRAFEEKMPDYFRLDLGFRLKRNYKNLTTTFALDIQNATNRENVFGSFYNPTAQRVKTYTQTPLIPVLAYKLEF